MGVGCYFGRGSKTSSATEGKGCRRSKVLVESQAGSVVGVYHIHKTSPRRIYRYCIDVSRKVHRTATASINIINIINISTSAGSMLVCMVIIITYSKSMDQPGKVAIPARGQLNRENEYFPIRVRA